MKQKNLSVLTLLASLMLLVFSGSAFAQTEVTFVSDNGLVHDCDAVIVVNVTTNEAIKVFDLIADLVTESGGAIATINSIELFVACGTDHGSDLTTHYPPKFRFWGCDVVGFCDVIPTGTQMLLAELNVTVGSPTGTFTIDVDDEELFGSYLATTGFVNANSEYTALTVIAGTYDVINTAPYFTNCPASVQAMCADGMVDYDFDADDDDCGTTLTYSLGTGTGGAIDEDTGLWEINVSQMCGTYNYQIVVTDEHDAQAFCNFALIVNTIPPVWTYVPDATTMLWGDMATGYVEAMDPDDCPQDITYTLENVTGPGTFPGGFILDDALGTWTWQTMEDPDYVGKWTFYVRASDGCEHVDSSFVINVLPTYRVYVEKEEGPTGMGVYQGHYAWLSVFLSDTTDFIGGYDFLIYYDASALTFMEAELGDLLVDCGWEYFTYRFGPFGNCGSSCPSGMLRIVGMADYNNGPYHPDADCSAGPGELAKLKFYVTNDRTYDCMYIPVGFYWLDCGDNIISGVSGDTAWIARHVYAYDGTTSPFEITGDPWIGGWQGIIPAVNCDADPDGDGPKIGPLPGIDFYTGGVDIICADSIDAPGDINLNLIPNEIADAVLFTNYFIYGLSVFDINVEGQIAASDVNDDGRVLTVGDLVYLIRVVVGDALPFPKLTPFANSVEVVFGDVVSVKSDIDVGAALFVFDGAGTVDLLADGMKIKSDVVDGQLRVLVWSDNTNRILAGERDVIAVSGNVNLVEVSVSDYNGNMMNVDMSAKIAPSTFSLKQNYPNPFNPTTDITIVLPEQSEWKLDIYNVAGQLIRTFSGYDIGEVTVTWDAAGVASGIYFYKATAGQYTDSKKMVLMK